MSTERLLMRQIREILRLRWACGLLSFATTPSGNAGLGVRLGGGLAARGTERCGSQTGSRHAGFAPCVRPLRTEASVEQRPIHHAGAS